ncbi:hypothetical protein AKO1_007844 [Acrasis kona]|uniref:Zn(2)-C6 fungal-type domain-containing protein n=1 Tax=Acrasis kona TaxID=1008807 RepID=A0AAW2YPH1_9EUKA
MFNISNAVPTNEDHLSVNSCSNCNKSHRKCDRMLPICTECMRKNKNCIYEKPKRVKRKKTISQELRYEPYPKSHQNNTSIPSTTPAPKQLYFHNINYGQDPQSPSITTSIQNPSNQPTAPPFHTVAEPPPVDSDIQVLTQSFERTMLNIPFFDSSYKKYQYVQIENGVDPESLPLFDKCLFALVLAMKSFYMMRIEKMEAADRSLQLCKQIVSTTHDTVMTNYHLAACFCYLALIHTDRGHVEQSAYYAHCLRGYLKRRESQPTLDRAQSTDSLKIMQEKYMRTMYHLVIYHNNYHVTDLGRLFKCMLCCHFLTKQHRHIDPTNTAHSVIGYANEEFIDKFMPLTDVLRYDLDNYKSTLTFTPEMIDLMTQRMKAALSAVTAEPGLYSRRMSFYMIAQGAKLQCLQRTGPEDKCKSVAMHLVDVSGGHMFHLCHHSVSGPLAAAITLLCRILDKTDDTQEQTMLMDKIQSGVSVLRTLGLKYKIVILKYGDVINSTEGVLKTHHQHIQLLSDIYSNIFMPVSPSNQGIGDVSLNNNVAPLVETDHHFEMLMNEFLKEEEKSVHQEISEDLSFL